MGCLSFNSLDRQTDISIHASVKEATWIITMRITQLSKFQSTPPRRRRRGLWINLGLRRLYFNPRLREGGDAIQRCCIKQDQNFNPRLREGGDLHCLQRFLMIMRFQSTPPRRRRPQHIVIPQLSCTYLVVTTFLSDIFSFISQYVVLFFLF